MSWQGRVGRWQPAWYESFQRVLEQDTPDRIEGQLGSWGLFSSMESLDRMHSTQVMFRMFNSASSLRGGPVRRDLGLRVYGRARRKTKRSGFAAESYAVIWGKGYPRSSLHEHTTSRDRFQLL